MPTKMCPGCNRQLPATLEFFTKRTKSKSGLDSYCKECNRSRMKKWASDNPELKKEQNRYAYRKDPEKYKRKSRNWRASNMDKKRMADQLWRDKNRESERKRSRQWYKNNKQYERKRSRLKYQNNKDYYSASNAKWSNENPEQRRAIYLRRRARKRSLPDNFTADQWIQALDFFDGCCAACGRPVNGLFHTAHADHWIPLSDPNCPGTVATNIIPLCGGQDGCNQSKSNSPATEWLEYKFGPRKAKQILARVDAYFAWVSEQEDSLSAISSPPQDRAPGS